MKSFNLLVKRQKYFWKAKINKIETKIKTYIYYVYRSTLFFLLQIKILQITERKMWIQYKKSYFIKNIQIYKLHVDHNKMLQNLVWNKIQNENFLKHYKIL